MRYSILLIVFIFCCGTYARAQNSFTPPDFKNIEKVTKDPQGEYYYPKLMGRYKRNDTSLTAADIHMLYYGVFFDKQIKPDVFDLNQYRDSVSAIYKKETLTEIDKRNLIKYYLQLHNKNPFEIRNINALYNLYSNVNDPAAGFYDYKLRMIVDVIVTTGDGKSIKSGLYVNSISDEYSLLNVFGFKSNGKQSLIDDCDYLEVVANDYKIDGLYFNVEKILEAEHEAFK